MPDMPPIPALAEVSGHMLKIGDMVFSQSRAWFFAATFDGYVPVALGVGVDVASGDRVVQIARVASEAVAFNNRRRADTIAATSDRHA